MSLQAIKFDKTNVTLEILDQLLLPFRLVYIPIRGIDHAYQAIKAMQVRGAPAIAIVGAFAVVIESRGLIISVQDFKKRIDYLVSSRPTAVNLSNACEDMKKILLANFKDTQNIGEPVTDCLYQYAVALYDDDLSNNYKIGENGLGYIVETLKAQAFKGPFSIVTVCNTGSLATSGHGTALGIIRTVHEKLAKLVSGEEFWFEHVYPLETRPYNQGAKLTTYELKHDNIPFTLICDNMATSLISLLHKLSASGAAPVKFIIAGADRVVLNGDSANKIGTHQLAAIASHFNNSVFKEESKSIKFIIAAPETTIDRSTQHGDDIVIEERPATELTTLTAPLVEGGSVGKKVTVGIATPGINVWNPAFDVTPNELISCIVTEKKAIHRTALGYSL